MKLKKSLFSKRKINKLNIFQITIIFQGANLIYDGKNPLYNAKEPSVLTVLIHKNKNIRLDIFSKGSNNKSKTNLNL